MQQSKYKQYENEEEVHITSHGTKFTYGAFAEETGAESEQRAVRMELAIEEAVSYTRTSQYSAKQFSSLNFRSLIYTVCTV